MIHRSPLPDVEIPDVPLTEYVLGCAPDEPDRPALIDGSTGRVLTYGELERAIRVLAGGLAAAGFVRGDVLALLAPNMPEYAVVFHAAAMAGGTITTINPAYTESCAESSANPPQLDPTALRSASLSPTPALTRPCAIRRQSRRTRNARNRGLTGLASADYRHAT